MWFCKVEPMALLVFFEHELPTTKLERIRSECCGIRHTVTVTVEGLPDYKLHCACVRRFWCCFCSVLSSYDFPKIRSLPGRRVLISRNDELKQLRAVLCRTVVKGVELNRKNWQYLWPGKRITRLVALIYLLLFTVQSPIRTIVRELSWMALRSRCGFSIECAITLCYIEHRSVYFYHQCWGMLSGKTGNPQGIIFSLENL